jgi:hypothetical protein
MDRCTTGEDDRGGHRRRHAPELCPAMPLAAAVGGEEHEGRARKAVRRRRRARGERVRCRRCGNHIELS